MFNIKNSSRFLALCKSSRKKNKEIYNLRIYRHFSYYFYVLLPAGIIPIFFVFLRKYKNPILIITSIKPKIIIILIKSAANT